MTTTPYAVPKLTHEERTLIDQINANEADWGDGQALAKLKAALQVAVEVELATIPIYLYAYYSINRVVKPEQTYDRPEFPETEWSRFADKAGALIMSVAVEEMLHLSLSANVLHSLGGRPRVYGHSPSAYPAVLPAHTPAGEHPWDEPIPLAKFSFEQLGHLLAIEYPAPYKSVPEGADWETIGQLYSYVRCIICSDWITDDDFRHDVEHEILSTDFSPDSIDTVYPIGTFDYPNGPPVGKEHSASVVARYASDEDAHVTRDSAVHGPCPTPTHLMSSELSSIRSRDDAMEAIATIDFQGEGFAHGRYDDESKDELSHYYKFLTLQSELDGYTQAYVDDGVFHKSNNVAPAPAPPLPPLEQYGKDDLKKFVYDMADNPDAGELPSGYRELVDIADGLYQYMLVMTETIFLVPEGKQKVYFYRTMHQSMIWILDKLLETLRTVTTPDGHALSATFANPSSTPLGPRDQAFATLSGKVNTFLAGDSTPPDWDGNGYLGMILQLPDVSVFWNGDEPAAPIVANPAYLDLPASQQGTGTGVLWGARSQRFSGLPPSKDEEDQYRRYEGIPKWPTSPPTDEELPDGAVRHTCMGLNSCADQGRTTSNECAGQGYCSTALAYDPTNPDTPLASDHTCHVLNACRDQGGCGLYGTADELAHPGHNDCQSLGSCATPINAERFITDGPHRGESVWLRAREVFEKTVWRELRGDEELPDVPHKHIFEYGPTIEWIQFDNGGAGMTSCGSSGMSGAGSCS